MPLLEDAWKEREEKLYKQIFGDIGLEIYPLSMEIFNRLNADTIDPRWLTHGVFRSPPTKNRKTWAYVTSGMSNPWESESIEEYSGLGVEFIMETDKEEMWAIEVLQTLMAYNILLDIGKMENYLPLDYGNRVPLSLSETIKIMMFTHPINFPNNFSIKSGKVDLLQVVGITLEELEIAKQTSSKELKEIIIRETGGLITRKERT